MSTAIPDTTSDITNIDVIESTTPQQSSQMNKEFAVPHSTHFHKRTEAQPVAPTKGLPIITHASLYTTYNNKIRFEPTADRIRKNYTHGNLIISKDLAPKRDENDRVHTPKSFSIFPDYIDLFHFITATPISLRNFYEVIDGFMDQKPRFDLDFPHKKFPNITHDEAYYYLTQTLDAINRVMVHHNVPYSFENNCLVFNSHGISDGHYKYSFHIVIDKLVHHGSKHGDGTIENEPNALYRLVRNALPDHIRDLEFLDSAVHSVFQNFRLIWCEKKDSGRPKILDPITEYVPHHEFDPNDSDDRNQQRKDLGLFVASLLSFSSDSQYLPSFIPEADAAVTTMRRTRNNNQIPQGLLDNDHTIHKPSEITDEQYRIIMYYFERQVYCKQYAVAHDHKNKVGLNRKCSGYCPIHKRVHDGVGAFISLDQYFYIWFNCYRQDQGIRQRGIRIGNCYNHMDNLVPILSNETEDVPETSQPDNYLQFGSFTEEQLQQLTDGTAIITYSEGQNTHDMPTNNTVNLEGKLEQIPTDSQQKKGLMSRFPIVVGNMDINDSNRPIITEHVAVDDNNNNILCTNKRVTSTLLPQPPNNSLFPINDFIGITTEPVMGEYIVIKDLFLCYVDMCKHNGRLAEISTLSSFTKRLNKLYHVKRRCFEKSRKSKSVLVNFRMKQRTEITTTNTNLPMPPNVNNIPQLDPLPTYFTNNLLEWRGGYLACKRLYNEWCKHADTAQQTRIYNSQKAFTIDLSKKYNYTIVNKYIDGKKQSCIRGYIHRLDEAKERLAKTIRDSIHKIRPRKIIPGAIVLDDHVVRRIDDMVSGMSEFALAVRASCGTEKTTRIIEYIREHIEELPRILFVTNRVTLADEHLQQLEGLGVTIYYNNKEGLIRDKKSICQIDSLYKIVAEEPFDLVVFDEWNSTLQHFITYVKNKKAVNDTLEAIIKTASRLIIADALLDERYLHYITMLGRDDLITYQYTHRPHINKSYSMIQNKLELVRLICEDIRRGKKVVVPTNVESLASSLAELIRKEHPNIRIGLYTGKTKKSRGTLLEEFRNCDLVIYTPTITCGVSFVENIFDRIYGYFSRSSCGPTLALQMMFRCRAVNQYRICIEGGGKSDLMCKNRYVITLSEYKRFFVNNYECAKGQELFERSYLSGEINTNTAYFHLYATVHQDICEGFKLYSEYLVSFLQEMGVRYIEDDYEEEERIDDDRKDEAHEAIKRELKTVRDTKKQGDETVIAEMELIDDKTAEAIQRSDDKGVEEILMLKKRRICKVYEVESFDAIFAREAMKLIRVHRNTRIYYEVSKHRYGTPRYQEELNNAMEVVTARKHDNDIFEFEGDKIADLQRVYQGRLCELALNIMQLLNVNQEGNIFQGDITIGYNDRIEAYIKLAQGFVEGYFREEGKIISSYMNGKYKEIIKRVLKQAFGITINFKTNVMTSPFMLTEDKFYPKLGTYNVTKSQTTYEEDNEIIMLSVDDMTEALRGG